jgi:hypothetical protein
LKKSLVTFEVLYQPPKIMKKTTSTILAIGLGASLSPAATLHVNDFGVGGWYSDDTRADGAGLLSAGTNLIGLTSTDAPEGPGSALHDAEIRKQIQFLPAAALPVAAPNGTNQAGALHLEIANSGSGKSQVSVRDNFGYGSNIFTTTLDINYTWLGMGPSAITTSFKLGVQTADFGSVSVSSRTGENSWDKVLVYEPGQGNLKFSDGTWQTEVIDFNNGKWWVFDRNQFVSSIGTPMTLAEMENSNTMLGTKTMAQIFDLISDGSAIVSSAQFGVGSGNALADVYVNEITANFMNGGDTIAFVPEPSLALGGLLCLAGLGIRRRSR